MDELRILYNLIERSGGFAFDFEATDEKGRPTTDPLRAKPTLLSIATGTRKVSSVCLEWSERAKKYLRYLLSRSELTAVAHYGNFDFPVAHWNGVDLEVSKATWSDTRLLCWMQSEEEDLGLKSQIEKHFGYKMSSFKSASESEFAQKAQSLKKELERLPVEMRKTLKSIKAELKAELKEEKRAIDQEWRGKIKTKEISAKKKEATAEMEKALAAATESVEKSFEERAKVLKGIIKNSEDLAWQNFRKYAIDDAKQTWRLYQKMMRWVKKEKLSQWLDVELANYRQSILMGLRGAYIDQSMAKKMIAVSKPILEEFEATIFNMAKREFNVRSSAQLAEVLYRDLGVKPPPGTGRSNLPAIKNEPWGYNADREVLERIDHPIGQAILNYRSVHTIFSNFMKGFLEQAKNDPLGKSRIHVNFNSTGTVTGRWSSSTQ